MDAPTVVRTYDPVAQRLAIGSLVLGAVVFVGGLALALWAFTDVTAGRVPGLTAASWWQRLQYILPVASIGLAVAALVVALRRGKVGATIAAACTLGALFLVTLVDDAVRIIL